MVALLCGRNRQVHLYPSGVLDGAESSFDTKLAETKNCQVLTTGLLRPGGPACLLAAAKRQVRDVDAAGPVRSGPVLNPVFRPAGPVLRDQPGEAVPQEAVGGSGAGHGPVAGHAAGPAVRGILVRLRPAGAAGRVVAHQPGEPGRPVPGLPGPAAHGRAACPGGRRRRGSALLQPTGPLCGRAGPALPDPGADVARGAAGLL